MPPHTPYCVRSLVTHFQSARGLDIRSENLAGKPHIGGLGDAAVRPFCLSLCRTGNHDGPRRRDGRKELQKLFRDLSSFPLLALLAPLCLLSPAAHHYRHGHLRVTASEPRTDHLPCPVSPFDRADADVVLCQVLIVSPSVSTERFCPWHPKPCSSLPQPQIGTDAVSQASGLTSCNQSVFLANLLTVVYPHVPRAISSPPSWPPNSMRWPFRLTVWIKTLQTQVLFKIVQWTPSVLHICMGWRG
ncbi:hypothetical protein EDB85DRAFT_1925926 [Lactarius pseudohatsudake]|nr:hypothetical protein EDB85DRAFT_1925926 [Lactarius pseudohatsudake]